MKVDTLPLGNLQTNCYFLISEDTLETGIIDPADQNDVIINKIKNENLIVKYIILTHAHFDHTGALDSVKEFTNAPVVIHSEENAALSDDNLNLSYAFGSSGPESGADILVNDNDTLPFSCDELTFIHTPGHTKGSMCIKINDILFSGDTLFYLSMGRVDFPGGSMKEMSQSLNKLMTLDDNTTVYPGHGEKTTIGYEKRNNPYIR